MADQAAKDPFDVLESIRSQNAPTTPAAKPPSEPAQDPFDVHSSIMSGANLTPEQKAAKEKNAAYEQRIQSWMPEAGKQAKEQGYLGAIGQGISNIPIVGPAVGAAGRYLGAATGAGSEKLKPEENTFANRVQNIAAWEEALNRQYGKQYPGTKAATEIGGSLFLPAGKVAEAVTGVVAPAAGATGTLAALRSAVAPALGYGTEGALYGAGSAAAEQAFGTTPESKEPSIKQGAIIGGGLGAALGTAGKAIQYGLEKIGPEWYRSFGKIDSRLAEAARQDIADGNVRMDYQQAIDRLNAGQPVALADMFGPKWQNMLGKSLKGRPEIADEIQTAMQNRTGQQADRFFDFTNTMRGSLENPQDLFDRAQQVAATAKNEAYREALTPGRNPGVWKPQWDSWLNNPDFVNAVGLTEREIISQMTANGIDARNFISPFGQKMVKDPKTGDMVAAVNPVTRMPELEVQLQNRIDNQYLDVLQRNLNKLADQRFRAAYAPQGGSAQGAATMRNDIVNTLKKEEINGRPNPFYDPVYKQAHDNTITYRENSNAYDYGSQLLSKIGNARDAAIIEAETRVMAPVERELATQGLLTDMYQRSIMGDGSINTKKLNNYFNPGPVRDSIKNVLGPENFNNLERYIKTEAIMKNTMAEINKMGRGNSASRDIQTLLYALIDYKLGGARLVGQWASGRMGDAYARDMVQKFGSGSVSDFDDVYRLLTTNPQAKRSFAEFIDATAAKLAAAGASNAGQLEQRGRAFGGSVSRKMNQNKIIQSAASELYKAAKPAMADGGIPKLTQNVYHGTRSNFSTFKDDPSQSSMSRGLGIHVAPDPTISSSDNFLKSRINDEMVEGANVMPLKTFPLEKFYKIHQPYYEDMGMHQTDDVAIKNDILHHGYTNDKSQFIKDVMQHRKYDKKKAELAHSSLISGKGWYDDGSFFPTMRRFVGSYHFQPSDPKDREKIIRAFRDHLRSQGYAGIQYVNTSPKEIKGAKDKTSLVIFPDDVPKGQQYPLRGRFAKMDVTRSHEPDIMAKNGGYIPHGHKQREKNLKDFHGKTPKEIKESRWFHGTNQNFSSFRPGNSDAIYVTKSPAFAGSFSKQHMEHWHESANPDKSIWSDTASRKPQVHAPNIMPVHVRAEKPFDYENKKHIAALYETLGPDLIIDPYLHKFMDEVRNGDWGAIESSPIQNAIKAMGHDSFFVKETGVKNLGVYDPSQIKSAIGNKGTFDRSNPDITMSDGGEVHQSVTSEKTSLNQVPALHKSKLIQTVPGHRNIDIGGGAYDLGSQYLASQRGIESHVFDPFNRTQEHNDSVIQKFTDDPAHSATVANVLNVIPERHHRVKAIKLAHDMTRPDAKAYFSIYEGNKSKKATPTSKGWQNNLPAESYINEIREVFPHVERKGNILIGHKVPPMKDGGIARPTRHTGGRIPEMDKLFKQAKKYVDSHTKTILGTPDDVVVKALRVAQRKF